MKTHFIFFALSLLAYSCAVEQPKPELHIPSQEHVTQTVLFTQQAAEYKALCYQAYNLAEGKLIEKLAGNPVKPAVLLDIDETILDNSPYTAYQILNDVPYTPETWAEWVALGKADAVPGVQRFLQVADSLGVALFYVSNRDTSALSATLKNMADLEMPQTTEDRFYLKSTTSDKESRRKAIQDLGYTIVLRIGDNLGDYESAWDKPASNDERKKLADKHQKDFGEDFIVLPNAMYGTWMGGVYEYGRSLSDSAQYEQRLNALTQF